MARRSAPQRFEVWEADGRVHSLDNPVRLRLMRLIEERPRRLTELVGIVGRAKSTLSAFHLPQLVRLGLLEELDDASDGRVKIYRLRGRRVGGNHIDAPALVSPQASGASTLQSVLEIINLDELLKSGARQAYIESVGTRLGFEISQRMTSEEPLAVTAELNVELARLGLGHVEWNGEGPARVDPKQAAWMPLVAALVKEAFSHRLAIPPRLELHLNVP